MYFCRCAKSTEPCLPPHPQTDRTDVDVLCYSFSLTGGGGGGGSGSEKAAALEQKLYKLQEELTELHRQKGEVHWMNIIEFYFTEISKRCLNKLDKLFTLCFMPGF